jgi:hypothetical protein
MSDGEWMDDCQTDHRREQQHPQQWQAATRDAPKESLTPHDTAAPSARTIDRNNACDCTAQGRAIGKSKRWRPRADGLPGLDAHYQVLQ